MKSPLAKTFAEDAREPKRQPTGGGRGNYITAAPTLKGCADNGENSIWDV